MATDLKVGGRVEEVAPRRVTDYGDRVRLLTLLAVAVLVHVIGIARTAIPTRDAITFARNALQFQHPQSVHTPKSVDNPNGDEPDYKPTIVDVLKRSAHPPGFPLAVLATSSIVCKVWDADLPDQMLFSAQITSTITAILIVFPMYWLGRMLFDKWVGFLAAMLFQLLPVVVEATSEGMSEGLFFLCIATALLFGVRTVRKPGIGGFLLCGLATGCAYLVRPEGMVVGAAVGAVIVGMAVFRRWTKGESAGRATALLVGTLLPALPYMLLIGGITNKPAGRNILPSFNIWEKKFQPMTGINSPVLFASWYDPTKQIPLEVWVVTTLGKEGSKAFHHAALGFAVIGLVVARRRFRGEPELWVLVVYGGLMLVAVTAMAYHGHVVNGVRVHYLSERHMLSIVYVGCFFAAAGIQALPGLLGRISLVGKWPGHPAVAVVLAIALVGSCVPKLFKARHADRVGHHSAGLWLKEHVKDADALIDPFEWAQYYSGRSLRHVPGDPPNAVRTYAVVEGKKDDATHSELPRRQLALNVENDGDAVLVDWWPKDIPPDQAKALALVKVYLLDKSIPRKK